MADLKCQKVHSQHKPCNWTLTNVLIPDGINFIIKLTQEGSWDPACPSQALTDRVVWVGPACCEHEVSSSWVFSWGTGTSLTNLANIPVTQGQREGGQRNKVEINMWVIGRRSIKYHFRVNISIKESYFSLSITLCVKFPFTIKFKGWFTLWKSTENWILGIAMKVTWL